MVISIQVVRSNMTGPCKYKYAPLGLWEGKGGGWENIHGHVHTHTYIFPMPIYHTYYLSQKSRTPSTTALSLIKANVWVYVLDHMSLKPKA